MSNPTTKEICDRLTEQLLHSADPSRVPIDLSVYHSVCNIQEVITQRELGSDGCLHRKPDSDSFRIEIDRSLPHGQKRLTWAHEIAHAAHHLASRGVPPFKLGSDGRNLAEHWFDYIGSRLLVPPGLIQPLAGRAAPTLKSILEIARLFDVPVVCAAGRFVETSYYNCVVVLWKTKQVGSVRLSPRRVMRRRPGSFAPAPEVTASDSQPMRALTERRPIKGRNWIDLGGGPDCHYGESMPLQNGSREGVLSIFVLEKCVEAVLARPTPTALLDSRQRTLF